MVKTDRRQANSDTAWKRKYKELLKFFSIYKHSRISCHSKDYPSLGDWIHKQRRRKDSLSKEQIKLLNNVNFVWPEDIRKEKNKRWLLLFKRLENFKREKGHCNVPSQYLPDKTLGKWVDGLRIRRQYLEEWKTKKLKVIGFKWSEDIQLEKSKRWYTMYRRLEQFYRKYGHSNVPEYWKKDVDLSIWVICQRRPKKPLTPSKVKLLNELKFSWNNTPLKRKRDNKGRFISETNKPSDQMAATS